MIWDIDPRTLCSIVARKLEFCMLESPLDSLDWLGPMMVPWECITISFERASRPKIPALSNLNEKEKSKTTTLHSSSNLRIENLNRTILVAGIGFASCHWICFWLLLTYYDLRICMSRVRVQIWFGYYDHVLLGYYIVFATRCARTSYTATIINYRVSNCWKSIQLIFPKCVRVLIMEKT